MSVVRRFYPSLMLKVQALSLNELFDHYDVTPILVLKYGLNIHTDRMPTGGDLRASAEPCATRCQFPEERVGGAG